MTVNAYLFMWNCHGIESIVPFTQDEINRTGYQGQW